MKNYTELMQRAQEVQGKIESLEAEGSSGGGLVKVWMSGKNTLKKIKLDPSLKQEDISMIEDLIIAATNDAQNKIANLMQEEMSKMAGGLPLGKMF
jgi:DNA-binding YbaB/EbfC family protein